MTTRAPAAWAASATVCAAAVSLNHGRASSQAPRSSRPSACMRAVSKSTIPGFSEWTVVGRPSAAARRSASSSCPSSTPGYMPGGATPPVKSLNADAPASAIRAISSGSSAR